MTPTAVPLRTWVVERAFAMDGDGVKFTGARELYRSRVVHALGTGHEIVRTDTEVERLIDRPVRLPWLAAPEKRGATKVEGLRWMKKLDDLLDDAFHFEPSHFYLDDYGPEKYGRTLGDLWYPSTIKGYPERVSISQQMLAAGCPPYLD